jgi:hypothetical protein
MWIESLKEEQKQLIERAASDAGALARWRELEDRIRALMQGPQPTTLT